MMTWMKGGAVVAVVVVLGFFTVLDAGSQEAAGPAAQGLARLKALAGEWETKAPDGKPVRISFKVMAGNSTVMEELSVGNMVTVYHLDGDSLMMTHYCAGNNQPRMRAKGLSTDGKSIDFNLVDVTNLPDPKGMHMNDLTITFLDQNTITERWVHAGGGKEEPMEFKLTRVK